MLKRLCYEEQGYSLVTAALLLMTLVMLLALVVDIGYAYVQRWQMQNAADAGALAGTRALFLGQDAQQAAADYAQRNGAENVTVTVEPGEKTVRVEAKTDFPTFVASILGIDTLTADNPAKAVHGGVAEMTEGVYPIAVDWQEFVFGNQYDIYAGGGPGNFGWLGWDGCTNIPCLCESLTPPGNSENYINPHNPSDHIMNIGDWVQGSTGVKNASCVRAHLDWFISTETPMTIIVWDAVEGAGAGFNYHIVGFAQFVLVSYRLPSENRITGRFIQGMIPTTKITLDPNADFGVHGMKLTE